MSAHPLTHDDALQADNSTRLMPGSPSHAVPYPERDAALAKVRDLLHGEEVRKALSPRLIYELDAAICDYGHAAASESWVGFQQKLGFGR